MCLLPSEPHWLEDRVQSNVLLALQLNLFPRLCSPEDLKRLQRSGSICFSVRTNHRASICASRMRGRVMEMRSEKPSRSDWRATQVSLGEIDSWTFSTLQRRERERIWLFHPNDTRRQQRFSKRVNDSELLFEWQRGDENKTRKSEREWGLKKEKKKKSKETLT